MLTSSWQMRHIEQILVRALDGEEASPSHDGAAATPALDLASLAPIVLPDRLMGGERGKGASRARAARPPAETATNCKLISPQAKASALELICNTIIHPYKTTCSVV